MIVELFHIFTPLDRGEKRREERKQQQPTNQPPPKGPFHRDAELPIFLILAPWCPGTYVQFAEEVG